MSRRAACRAAVVELRNVTKTYGPVRALVGVSCRFEEGTVTVVSGPNGSGKSTLLGIVGTLTRPTSGEVDHGALGSRARRRARARLGWVGHESLCYPDLTGRQNIELAARLHGCDAHEAFERAAARFELGGVRRAAAADVLAGPAAARGPRQGARARAAPPAARRADDGPRPRRCASG